MYNYHDVVSIYEGNDVTWWDVAALHDIVHAYMYRSTCGALK